jgi:hypothetical protein
LVLIIIILYGGYICGIQMGFTNPIGTLKSEKIGEGPEENVSHVLLIKYRRNTKYIHI